MNAQDIRVHMNVFGSCGNKLGRVDRLEGGAIKLTRDSAGDGQHHFIPMAWVARVDQHVHLNLECGKAKQEWDAALASSGG